MNPLEQYSSRGCANTRPDFVSILLLLKVHLIQNDKIVLSKDETSFSVLSCFYDLSICLSSEFGHTCQWSIPISVTAFLPCSKIEPVAIAVRLS